MTDEDFKFNPFTGEPYGEEDAEPESEPDEESAEPGYQWRETAQEPAPSQGINLTPDQLQAIFRDLSSPQPQPLAEPEPDDFEERIVRKASDNLGSQVKQMFDEFRTEFRQQRDADRAPALKNDLVDELTIGLGEPAKKYLNDYFQGYTPDVFEGIRKDPKTMDMLRRAAEYENGRAPVQRRAPRTEGVHMVTENLDSNFERSIDAMWKGGFNSVPGLTKEKFREEMKRRVS
jgi:hypothetical protein